MLSCKELTELATDYLEKDLRWPDRLRVQIHLWMCKHCRRYLNQMRHVIGLLRRLPTEPAPADLVEELLPQFREARDKQV
ncbi:MAG: anti-sigma factor family protein [Candidatus Binataceae bacterium]